MTVLPFVSVRTTSRSLSRRAWAAASPFAPPRPANSPLSLPLQNPSVPEDAAVVVVAEPQATLPESAAAAIRKYMNEPRKSGAKGKLIVLAGAVPGPDDKVVKTGLEGLLAEFDHEVGRFLWQALDRGRVRR